VLCQTGSEFEKSKLIESISQVMIPKDIIDSILMRSIESLSSNTNFYERFSKYKEINHSNAGKFFYANLFKVLFGVDILAAPIAQDINKETKMNLTPVISEKLYKVHREFLSNFSYEDLRQIDSFAKTSAGKKMLSPNSEFNFRLSKNLVEITEWVGSEAEKITVDQLGGK
jgi:hypothetical protein